MASDVYLKVGSIEGESTDAGHKGWIEVLSYSFGASMMSGNRSTSGSATRERVSLSDINVSKLVDAASTELFRHTCSGVHIPEVKISINRTGDKQVEYLLVTLTDVLVTSYQLGGADGAGVPTESIAFNYGTIKITYSPTDQKGATKGAKNCGWDATANKPV